MAVTPPVGEFRAPQLPSAPPGYPVPPLPDGPLHYVTGEGRDIEVTLLGRGISHPWGMAALPDGTLLVSERNKGTLRAIHKGKLDPTPIAGVPRVRAGGFTGLLDVVLHPDLA